MSSYGKEFEDKVFAGWNELDIGKKNNKFDKAIEIFLGVWNELPEPKCDYNESFLIVKWMLEIAIELNDTDMMKKWVPYIMEADLKRDDIGEREQYSGEVYYELGDLEKAYKFFDIANKKSRGGRCFAGRNNKYKQFYLNYNK